jgi:peptidoglycan/xylan/chitin deacetylase (PgdA/CDA1 family)
MSTISTQYSVDSLSARFVLGGREQDNIFREWLAADTRAAHLSPAFRAYYQLRSLIPLPVRQLLQRYRQVETSPRWCYPDAFLAALAEQIGGEGDGLTIIHPWPDGADFAFVLTHDVETAEGLRNIPKIAALEEQLGFRSSWNVVPYKYPVDQGLLRDLTGRGFEIGVHGYNHDGKLFASRSVFNRRVPAINAALKSFGAVGFRAPMVHRNLNWLQSLDIEYDASYFDADPYQAMPGGVGGLWPFIAARFVELPYTLPQDHTLFVALSQRDGQIWHDKLDYIAKLHGMSLVITHPDYLDSPQRIEIYRAFLERAREMNGLWHALPKDVAVWWRTRDESALNREQTGEWTITGPAAARARAATIHATVESGQDNSAAGAHQNRAHFPMASLEWTSAAATRQLQLSPAS